ARAAGGAARRGVRHRAGAPRRGVPRQPRARLFVSADGAESFSLGVALQQAAAVSLQAGAAVPHHHGDRRAGDYLPAGDDDGRGRAVRPRRAVGARVRGPAWRVACFAWLLAGGCAANTASLRDTRPCPSDLALDVSERLVDARRHPPWDLKQYQKLRWPAEHGDPMSPAFFVDAQAAIARVLELEAQQPKLIPAGFRADVRARPRDPWLRLRMARCELHAQHARRRAS